MDATYAFGIEEEYFLADAETGESPSEFKTDRFHAEAAGTCDLAEHELLKGQVEFASEPATDQLSTCDALQKARYELSKLAGTLGLSLIAAGSHPLGRFEHQETTEKSRYKELEEQFGIIAHRSMCCAMHVHVEMPEQIDRVRIMNRLIPFLPLLLALSTSSPFWSGEATGLKSARLAVFSEWPRMGLPDLLADRAEYDRFVSRLVGAGNMSNASFIWWLIRPSNKYHTLEMRVCDACTRADEAVAIAALYRSLVHAAVRLPSLNDGIGPFERAITAENLWQTQRLGTQAKLIDPVSGAVATMSEVLEAALTLTAEDADTLGCADWAAKTRTIIERGSSADRQIARFAAAKAGGAGAGEALRDVVEHLAAETAGL